MTDAADSPAATTNPYAPPTSDLVGDAPAENVAAHFYRMSTTKLWIMSLLTLGLYDLCFWWRHWRARRQAGDDVSVFWRTVFSPIAFFWFKTTLQRESVLREVALPSTVALAPGLYVVANILGRALDRVESPEATLAGMVLPFMSTWAVVQAQTAANALTAGTREPMNDSVTPGSIIMGVLGALLWLLILSTVLFPEAFVE